MKFQKLIINFISLSFILFVLVSCKKEEVLLANTLQQGSKIKTIYTAEQSAPSVGSVKEYIYDSKNRLIEIKEYTVPRSSFKQSVYYHYYDNYIVIEMPTSGDFNRYDTLYLNDDGMIYKYFNGGTFSYSYNSDYFLLDPYSELTFDSKNILTYYRHYSYDEYSYADDFIFKYYEEANTIYLDFTFFLEKYSGNHNIGITFWGRQNENLLKSIKTSSGYLIYEFSYTYDEKGRVNQMMNVANNGMDVWIKTFTYYE